MHHVTTVRLALLAVIWGSSFLWIMLAIRGLSPAEVTLTRLSPQVGDHTGQLFGIF